MIASVFKKNQKISLFSDGDKESARTYLKKALAEMKLKPEELANYANSLAEKFHEYYEKVAVIHSDEQVKNARAILVTAVQIVLRNCMELLGIRVSERM